MFEAQAIEFPFVAAMPKREKSGFVKVWDHFQELKAVTAQKGMIVPVHMAACLLGVSHQRVSQFLDDGRLEPIEIRGHRYVAESSLVEFCKVERKNGRPVNLPVTAKESWRRARSKDPSK